MSALAATYRVEVSLALYAPVHARERVQVHHGTRPTAARAVCLEGDRTDVYMNAMTSTELAVALKCLL